MKKQSKRSFSQNLWAKLERLLKKEIDVYFISGMCYNCKVFDKLVLPKGYRKLYIEWHVPRLEDSLSDYVHKMAEQINTKRLFILIALISIAVKRIIFIN